MTYRALWLASWLLQRVHEALAFPICALLGLGYYYFAAERRRLVEENLRTVLGPGASPQQVSACARQAFVAFVENYYMLYHLPGYSREGLRKRYRMEGFANIEEGLEQGRGVVIATMHFGSSETLMQVTTLYPHWRFLMLVEKMPNPEVLRMMSELRAAKGIDLATTEEPMRVIRRLRENGVVGIACDRDVTGTGVEVEFFGRTARLPDGAVRIAARTGAKLVPAYGWRDTDGFYVAHVEPALPLQHSGDAEADAQVNIRLLARALERAIGTRPCGWMAFHKVWNHL